MKKRITISLLFVMCMMFVFGAMSVFAAGATQDLQLIKLPDADASTLNTLLSSDADLKKKLTLEDKPGVTSTDHQLVKEGTGGIQFNPQGFGNATDKSRKTALAAFVKALQSSNIGSQSQQKVIDEMSASSSDVSRMMIPLVMDSTNADLYGAMKVIQPFLPFIRLVLGLGAFCIFLFLMASTVVDLAFIGLPIARESLTNKGEQSKSGKIPFVSADALSVIKETESALDSSGGYKNGYVMYFKRRVLTYIILSVCVLYLVVGELGGLIAWLLSLGSGFVQK